MGIKAKILKELQKKPRRLKELKAKLGNDKKVARAVDELVERNKAARACTPCRTRKQGTPWSVRW